MEAEVLLKLESGNDVVEFFNLLLRNITIESKTSDKNF